MSGVFPVMRNMAFTDRMRIYRLIGSAAVPDAETLMIPLMTQQVICMPMRMNATEDWIVISYQNLTDTVLPLMGNMRFALVAEHFVLATF